MFTGLNTADMVTGKAIKDITAKGIVKTGTKTVAENATEKEITIEDATTDITKTEGKEEIPVLKE